MSEEIMNESCQVLEKGKERLRPESEWKAAGCKCVVVVRNIIIFVRTKPYKFVS